jgi:hypothetical protein
MARTTKNDLIYEIRNAGYKANKSMTMDALQEIYDKLHVHREPDVKPEELNTDQEEQKAEIEQEGSQTIINPPEIEPEEIEEGMGETAEPGEQEEKAGGEVPPSDFDSLMGKISGATPPEEKAAKDKPLITKTRTRKKKGESSPDSFRLEGYVLLLITDTVFPFAFAFLNNLLDKRIKIDATDLQLTQKDFDKLEPLADQAADYMSIGMNPIAGFALVATFMYSNNLIMIRASKA